MPMKNHENILVFYKKLPTYNPQMTEGSAYDVIYSTHSSNYGKQAENVRTINEGFRYPLSVQEFNYDKGKFHPTQKPISLFSYLIKTYSNENDIVLDNCLGVGTTALACKMLNRNYIGCEISKDYCEIAEARIKSISNPLF